MPSGRMATRAPAFLAAVTATRSMVPSSCPITRTGSGPPATLRARRTAARAAPMARGVMTKPSGRSTPVISSSGRTTPVYGFTTVATDGRCSATFRAASSCSLLTTMNTTAASSVETVRSSAVKGSSMGGSSPGRW